MLDNIKIGAIVILNEYPTTKWVVKYGEYDGHTATWYLLSIPTKEYKQFTEYDRANCKIIYNPTCDKHEYTKDEIDLLLDLKQDKLIAGTNITIEDNVISATGGGSGTVDQHYDSLSANAQSGKAVEEAVRPAHIALANANNALDMLGEVPEDTDVQSEIDRLNSIVSILRDLAKKSTYTENVTDLIAELDSYFDEGGVIQNGSMLTIKSDVTAVQNGSILTIS